MAIHPNFPKSPYEIIKPEFRWFPADELFREKGYNKLLPPLVAKLRKEVEKWRNADYDGASATGKALLHWWFKTEHPMVTVEGDEYLFQYYFAQREAVETVIYLYEIVKVKNKYNLMRFDRLRMGYGELKNRILLDVF